MLSHYVSGEPHNPMVVLVHGVCDSALAWVDLLNHLRDRYFVVALDSLGHGTSRRLHDTELADPAAASAEELERTLQYLEQLYGQTPVIVAHSMGAAISSYLGGRRPELMKALFLEDPAWLSPAQAAGYRQRASEQVSRCEHTWQANPVETLADNVAQRPGWSAASHYGWALGKGLVDPRLLATGIVSFREPWPEIVAALRVPTKVVTSDTDEVLIGPEGVDAIAQVGNPLVQTEVISGTGHGVRLGAPEQYHASLDEWLHRYAG